MTVTRRQFPNSAATECGGPFTADAVNRLIERIGARAGLSTVHAHTLRHDYSYALVNGVGSAILP